MAFRTRAHLARQLLEMANRFGDNPSNFVLYITDPSPDNFAVNEETNTLKMIDLENIIVVDKGQLIESNNMKAITLHYSIIAMFINVLILMIVELYFR